MVSAIIMASGQGTNADHILKWASAHPKLISIKAVLCDKQKAGVFEVATRHQTPAYLIDPKNFESIKILIQQLRPDWVFLAGYMRMLPLEFLKLFYDQLYQVYRAVNVHPSLLPQYPGVNSYQRAFYDGCLKTGVTMHLVDEGLDTGPILLQDSFELKDKFKTLHELIEYGKSVEHQLYAKVLESIVLNKWPQMLPKKGDQL